MIKEKYKRWGFKSNPFIIEPLEPSAQSSELLVGRGKLKEEIIQLIQSNTGIVTIEGVNGIGKTSLLNVISYYMHVYSLNHSTDVLYVPCIEVFELRDKFSVDEISNEIYFALAQTLIDKAAELKTKKGSIPDTKYLDVWLNSTELQSIQGTIAGFGAGQSRTLNTADGFSSSGFRLKVKKLLKEIFPTNEDGGIICIVDNMELVKTSEAAMDTMNWLRDNAVNIKGTKWIFSGSNGVISAGRRNTRLSSFLHEPVQVRPVKSTFVTSFLNQRIQTFKKADDPYLPFNVHHFKLLYNELNGNLRDTLQKIGSYCSWIDKKNKDPYFPNEKTELFQKWLEIIKKKTYTEIKNSLSNGALLILKNIIKNKGKFNQDELSKQGIKNINELEDFILELDSNGLISLDIFAREQFKKAYGTYLTDASGKIDLVNQQEVSNKKVKGDIEDISDFYELEYLENDEVLEDLQIITISPRGSIIANMLD